MLQAAPLPELGTLLSAGPGTETYDAWMDSLPDRDTRILYNFWAHRYIRRADISGSVPDMQAWDDAVQTEGFSSTNARRDAANAAMSLLRWISGQERTA